MELILTPKESEDMFFTAMCNFFGGFCRSYGFAESYSDEDYEKARDQFKKNNPQSQPCIEDVYIEMIRMGLPFIMTDEEGDGENTVTVTLDMIHDRVKNAPFEQLSDMINEKDDAYTADVILQQVFFNEQIYG